LTRSEILKAAERCVCTDRNQQYGEPEDNFRTISMLWSVYLCARGMEQPLGAADVGAMMALFKLGRIATGGNKADNFIDLAGYAACAGEISTESEHTSKGVKKVSAGSKGSAEHEKTAFPANRIVRMTRSADGTYLVKTGCAIREVPDLRAAIDMIQQYESEST
jgi:hypothetical protein